MKRDLKGAVASMSTALGYEYDDAQISAFAEAASFDSMKNNADQFAPESGSGMWKEERKFFANGTNEQWRSMLTEAEATAFDARLAELLPEDQAQWIVNGNG
jgi:aryl sulfotransferase